jgi:RimJ/RimL family protein N-acetyltransferase
MAANIASGRVLEKAGFVRECTLSKWYVDREGTIHDGIMFCMTQ